MATVVIQKRIRRKGATYPVYYKDPMTGKKKYYKTFQKRKDAQRAANELRAMIDSGKLEDVNQAKTKRSPLTFEEIAEFLMAKWNQCVEAGELSEKTVEDYSGWLRKANKTFGKKLLAEISGEEILKYRNDLASKNSNILANRVLFVIKQVYKYGMEISSITSNPAESIRCLSEKHHCRSRFLNPEELEKLLRACDELSRGGNFMRALILLAAEHGASRQEALNLKWSDIDFKFGGRGLITFYRKKNGVKRTHSLMPRTKAALLKWRGHQSYMRKRKRIGTKSDFVFTWHDGTPIKQFYKSWRNVCKIAGLEGLHFHDLRHTYCSNLILSGADIKDVKEMIGHKDLAMTDRYTHLASERQLMIQRNLAAHYITTSSGLKLSGGHIGVT